MSRNMQYLLKPSFRISTPSFPSSPIGLIKLYIYLRFKRWRKRFYLQIEKLQGLIAKDESIGKDKEMRTFLQPPAL